MLVKKDADFAGIITDGDLRRSLQKKEKFFSLKAKDLMTKDPVSITSDQKANDALLLMENRPSQISVLPVLDTVNGKKVCVGLVRLHDLIGQL